MARGRRPDPDQEAKGFPNRRKSATRKREEEAERVAQLLMASTSGDVLQPPAMIDQGPLYAGAVAVWREMAPRLARTHRLPEQHRMIFAMFCVYYADWVSLNDQLKQEGMTQRVKTVAGGFMIRDHPAVRRRQECFDNVMALSKQFGLTPHDEYDLFKNQAGAAATNPGLFGGALAVPAQRKGEPEEEAREPAADVGPRVGMLGGMDSPPPGQRPN
ncbi:putative phage terminase, small subunit, P27 family [Sphingobium herbicidovorans NBRC 16415]|uniref:Phage terminase, small subunit, P27 family n=1 Tax=Sphingobium herbicidovorans (strain ATCC 700291 / DSM 11019 / CCUG 56400 / KCTC 2939 / LMG 18315 / NBRC 16415 / MH) TaxID=1219045 RepID=A0A086PE96_SPHHM|nr:MULTISPECIES: P27 family phage terminase small subunit [Sphingobium]KFG91714.1 putative phage terminase, small subunit, P27 family [Sphingobium herbicidovorans NBRC 16415]